MKTKYEKAALKLYQSAIKKITNERIDEAYVDLCRIVSQFPDTLIAHKSRFFLCAISLANLYAMCLMTEAFSIGVKCLDTGTIMSLFNQDRSYFVNQYEAFAAKRNAAFNSLKRFLSELIKFENFAIIKTFIVVPQDKIDKYNPIQKVARIKRGMVMPDHELNNLNDELTFYILLTIITDTFDIEYTDELSKNTLRKLNRVEFYDACVTWIKKFWDRTHYPDAGELIRKSCNIILNLTAEAGHPLRTKAYENFQSTCTGYYDNLVDKTILKEIEVEDIEQMTILPTGTHGGQEGMLINLVSCDVHNCEHPLEEVHIKPVFLEYEIDLEPSDEILQAKAELFGLTETNEEDKFDLKIEFD